MLFDTLKRWFRIFDRDQVFAVLGIESRRSATAKAAVALGVASVGALIGVGLGLLLAPSSGEDLRVDLRRRLPAPLRRASPSAPAKDGARV
jgi:hypothetical protein